MVLPQQKPNQFTSLFKFTKIKKSGQVLFTIQ